MNWIQLWSSLLLRGLKCYCMASHYLPVWFLYSSATKAFLDPCPLRGLVPSQQNYQIILHASMTFHQKTTCCKKFINATTSRMDNCSLKGQVWNSQLINTTTRRHLMKVKNKMRYCRHWKDYVVFNFTMFTVRQFSMNIKPLWILSCAFTISVWASFTDVNNRLCIIGD